MLVDLIKENLCGMWIVDALNDARRNLFASGRQICVKVNVIVYHTDGGRGSKLG